jgi:hypothetical protein
MFQWGLNIDDMWKYGGSSPPNSVVIPYLLSEKTYENGFVLPHSDRHPDKQRLSFRRHGRGRSNRNARDSTKVLASFLKKNKVDFVRCWFQWNFFEQPTHRKHSLPSSRSSPSPSSNYRYPLDDFVSSMTEAGIGIIGAIGTGYHRFLPAGLQTDYLEPYLKRLTESCNKIVRHYKDRVKVWQIENEPNWWKAHYLVQWRKGAIWVRGNQETILSALHSVVRSECPDATIMVNLEADESADLKPYAKYCDILGLDLYPNYSHSAPTDASKLATIALQAKRETGLPVFVVETGYPTGPRLFGFDEDRQSEYVHSACEQAFTCDAITGLGWFRFSDSYWKSFPPQENYFGLLTKEGRPKSGWNEYIIQTRQSR